MGVTGCRNPRQLRSEERFGARKDREEDKMKDKGALKLDTPKSMGPDRLHPSVLSEMVDVMV